MIRRSFSRSRSTIARLGRRTSTSSRSFQLRARRERQTPANSPPPWGDGLGVGVGVLTIRGVQKLQPPPRSPALRYGERPSPQGDHKEEGKDRARGTTVASVANLKH